jgi:hypothetical protein
MEIVTHLIYKYYYSIYVFFIFNHSFRRLRTRTSDSGWQSPLRSVTATSDLLDNLVISSCVTVLFTSLSDTTLKTNHTHVISRTQWNFITQINVHQI